MRLKIILSCMFIYVLPIESGCFWTQGIERCKSTWECTQYFVKPEYVSCQNKPNITVVITRASDRKWLTSSRYHKTFDKGVRYFIANSNHWSTIQENSLNSFINTIYIDLSDNNIEIIKSPFTGLLSLKYLNLSNNQIESLSDTSFSMGPGVIENPLETLDLSHNNLFYIRSPVFSNLRNLQKLILAYNKIDKIYASCFQHLNGLTYLDIGQNNLTDMKNFVTNTSKLKYLDVSYNFVKELSLSDEVDVIHPAPLMHLNLSHNAINLIQFDYFKKFALLEVLDLSYNNISTLHNLEFVNNKNMTYLDLSSNNITAIVNITTGDSLFNSDNLQYFYIENNNITGDITKNTFRGCSHMTSLSITYQFIQAIKENAFSDMSNVQQLNFSYNIISSIENSSFYNANSLTVLDVSHNRINNLHFLKMVSHNLTELYISNNQILIVPKDTFMNHNNIKKLLMSLNSIIIFEQNSLPLSNIKYMDVKFNRLNGSILCNVFSPSKLQNVDLYNMNYNAINESAFINMPLLKSLNISHNLLNYIHPHNFDGVDELEVLNLFFNKLTKLNLDFKLNVKYLYLEHNKFTSVPNIFKKEARLYAMNISFNDIASITRETFQNLSHLHNLDLSANKITELALGIFQNLQRFEFLNVSFNRIDKLGFGCFRGLIYTKRIDLSNNNIRHLEEFIFHDCTSLEELIIDNNEIKMINLDTLKSISSLKSLSLGGNSISCKDIAFHLLVKASQHSHIKITSQHNIFYEDNVRGIKCAHIYNTTGVSNKNIDTYDSVSNSEQLFSFVTNSLLDGKSNKSNNSGTTTIASPTSKSALAKVERESKINGIQGQGSVGWTTTALIIWCSLLSFITFVSFVVYVYKRRMRKLHIERFSASKIQFNNSLDGDCSSVALT